MILDEAEPELTGYVHATAVLPVNAVILKKFSKGLRQFLDKYRRHHFTPITDVKENRAFC
jgi:hypothetical protein